MKRIITFALALILLLQPGVEMRAGAEAASPTQVTSTDATATDATVTDATVTDATATDTQGDVSTLCVPEYGRGSLPVNYTPPEYTPAIAMNGVLPSRYDGRTLGYLSSIRNQNPYNVCWTFSMSGTAEANILKKYGTPTNIDISELQISCLTNNGPKKSDSTYNDPLNLFGGDHNSLVGTHSITDDGNVIFCVNTVASWMGITQEDTAVAYNQTNAQSIKSNGLDYA